ncbi:MAG: recombinase family protein [Candidatus Competibacteraceae bacterium]|nr:recombinase family protein [Candidatus Competibacteraceae bacterium]MCB1810652.1 recombinase family protein [Candidatus Competibacteraceae bacterium]
MTHPKIQPSHQQRQAIIYVRQSTRRQVAENQESQNRQYQLRERVQALGWPAARCIVIDDDLGLSGASSSNRPGYQRLISKLALREVGLIVGLEVSRLARNCLDWYQLLELAAAFDTLIADEDGVYDPSDFNDRLLLGLKGQISEVERYQIHARMQRGRLNKARRGELIGILPVGLDYDRTTQRVRLSVDQSVRHAISHVFDLFRQLRSIRAVLHYLSQAQLELPRQIARHGLGRELRWQAPSYDVLYALLTNPRYAGIYCHGRRQRQHDPLTQQVHIGRRQREDWEVFLPNHHPGYITLAEFEDNQRILADNCSHLPHPGAPRRGPSLLQGLVYCQHCGRRMRVCYNKSVPYYTCDAEHRRYASAVCNRASAKRVDALVEELCLNVINADTVELSWSYQEKLAAQAQALDQRWREKLQRLDYQAELARRRYEQVDPANRLVAQTLETEWNQCLVELKSAQHDYQAQRPSNQAIASTYEQMQQMITQLRQHWYSARFSEQEKKELLRCLIEQVFLQSRGKVIRARLCWYGGAVSELDVPKYLFSAPALYHRIRELAQGYTDTEIATQLNQEAISTVKGKPWTPRRVMDFRLSNAIPSGFTTNAELRLPASGYITSAEAAAQLGVSQSTIQKWYKLGVLSGKHDGGQAVLWIRWTEEVGERLAGGATPHQQMVSVRFLCHTQNKQPDEVLAWAQQNGHTIYRLRRGTSLRFYVLPAKGSLPLQ